MCARGIITSYPVAQRPTAEQELAPPTAPVDLWAALAWVKLLAPGRFGPERGLLNPAPLAAACFGKGTVRDGVIAVEHSPILSVRGLASIEAEHIEAVLASTAWPAPKDIRMKLVAPPRGLAAAGDVSHYFAPDSDALGVLDAQTVRDTMRTISPKIGACWNETLVRRAGIGGGRTFRLRTDQNGQLVSAWVSSSLTDGAPAVDAILNRCIAQSIAGLRFPERSVTARTPGSSRRAGCVPPDSRGAEPDHFGKLASPCSSASTCPGSKREDSAPCPSA